jgi:hypothetical protein
VYYLQQKSSRFFIGQPMSDLLSETLLHYNMEQYIYMRFAIREDGRMVGADGSGGVLFFYILLHYIFIKWNNIMNCVCFFYI